MTAQRDELQTAVTDVCWLLVGGEMHHQQDEQQQKLSKTTQTHSYDTNTEAPKHSAIRAVCQKWLMYIYSMKNHDWISTFPLNKSAVVKKSQTGQNDPITSELSPEGGDRMRLRKPNQTPSWPCWTPSTLITQAHSHEDNHFKRTILSSN